MQQCKDLVHFYEKRKYFIWPTWNQTVKRDWRLPNNSHRADLVGLNSGSHATHIIYRRFCQMVFKLKSQETNNTMKLIVLNSLNDYRSQHSKNTDFIVTALELESISTLNELCSVCKKCIIFPNLDNGTVQCIRYTSSPNYNGVSYA